MKRGNIGDLQLKWCHEVGPIYVMFIVHKPFIVSINPDDVKEMTTNPVYPKDRVIFGSVASVCGERFLGGGLLTVPDYDTWRPQRSLFDPTFKMSFLKNLVPSFNECADKMIKKLMLFADGKTSVKISEEFTLFTLNVISKVAFGSDFSDPEWKDVYKLKHSKGEQGLFYLVSHALRGAQMSLAFPMFKLIPGYMEGYREAARAVRALGYKCIEKRIRAIQNGEEIPNDILSQILQIKTGNDLDIEELIDHFVTFYVGGSETTANLLSITLCLLHAHPDIMERVIAETDEVLGDRTYVDVDDLNKLTYLEQVLKESLRLYPTAGIGFTKEAPQGCVLSGYHIPHGTTLWGAAYVSGRWPEFFDNPDKFDPDRFDPQNPKPSVFKYYPFGIGHRACVGKTFVMIEAKVILSRLLQQFVIQLPKDYNLHVEQKITLEPKDGVTCTINIRG